MNEEDLPGPGDPKTLAERSARAIEDGKPFESLEIATEGLKRWPDNVGLLRVQGRAWTRSGVPEQANRIFTRLYEKGDRHPETLGNLARTHKDFGLAAADPAERECQFRKAMQYYAMAYDNPNEYWNGINVATLATILGETAKAAKVARAVRDQCQQLWNADGGDRYWLAATLGEAELNLENWSAAELWYHAAAGESPRRFGDRSSSRRQARLLLKHQGRDINWIDALLRVPKVAVFVGHMCDQPGRLRPRFPAQLEQSVEDAIRDRLRKQDALIGFSSAACGSDILFLKTLLELNGEAHVVLPYQKVQFARDSVEIVPGWKGRYDAVIGQLMPTDKNPGRVIEVSQGQMEWQSVSYDYANLVLHGLALRRAKDLDSELVYLAVWDGRPGDGPGGTESVVKRWRKLGLAIEHIDLAKMLHKECPDLVMAHGTTASAECAAATMLPPPETKVLALLFADAVGSSKFTERQSVRFT